MTFRMFIQSITLSSNYRLRLLPILSVAFAYPPAYREFFNDFPEAIPEARSFGLPTTFHETARAVFFKVHIIKLSYLQSNFKLNIQDAGQGFTVDGDVVFTQNFLSGSDTFYKIWLRGDNMEGKRFEVGLATDCAGAGYVVGTNIYRNTF